MQYEILVVGAFEVNCVVLWADPSQAWVVDPGADAAAILDFLDSRKLQVGQIVLTHGHIDHISALDALLARFPAPVCLHAADAQWAFTPFNRLPPYLHVPARPDKLQTDLGEGSALCSGKLVARIVHTPGHTPGGCCLWFEEDGLLISGDTLFADSVGRTDLPGGDWPEMRASLAKLRGLPDALIVIPGHGPTTTLGAEKRGNPYLTGQVQP
jgi:glyoxylase-like metal-dependent hydrolase (beta-lactamase superfamily II)